MDEKNLTVILEIDELIVVGQKSNFLDSSLLMHMAKFNAYDSEEDARADGEEPRKIKLQLRIYIEDLD